MGPGMNYLKYTQNLILFTSNYGVGQVCCVQEVMTAGGVKRGVDSYPDLNPFI